MKSILMAHHQKTLEIPNLPEAIYEDARRNIAALKAEGIEEIPKVSDEVGWAWLESVLAQKDGKLN